MAFTLSQLIKLQCLSEKLKLGLVHLDAFFALTLHSVGTTGVDIFWGSLKILYLE